MNLNNLISSFGIKSNLASDVSFLILFFLASFVISFALGKHRILVSLLGVYTAYAVVNLTHFDFLKEPQSKSLLFLAIVIGFIVTFSGIIRGSVAGSGPAFMAKMVVGTAIVIGLSLSVILGWYPAKDFADIISPNIRKYFTDSFFGFLWAIAPLVYLGAIRRKID